MNNSLQTIENQNHMVWITEGFNQPLKSFSESSLYFLYHLKFGSRCSWLKVMEDNLRSNVNRFGRILEFFIAQLTINQILPRSASNNWIKQYKSGKIISSTLLLYRFYVFSRNTFSEELPGHAAQNGTFRLFLRLMNHTPEEIFNKKNGDQHFSYSLTCLILILD